jgi:hypothetical protein
MLNQFFSTFVLETQFHQEWEHFKDMRNYFNTIALLHRFLRHQALEGTQLASNCATRISVEHT